MFSRNETGDWVWSSDEDEDEENPGKNKTSKTPKVVRIFMNYLFCYVYYQSNLLETKIGV